ncbi:hypothetical protein SXCC_02273 [Gluconacetobacter sp. SXCC-1]|nr:hypothetical protein SXCC_02273 [Gluconacetobacter sp. SXCC-1]
MTENRLGCEPFCPPVAGAGRLSGFRPALNMFDNQGNIHVW